MKRNRRMPYERFIQASKVFLVGFLAAGAVGRPAEVEHGEMAGYLIVPNERIEQTYNAGFTMYSAAWPLLERYPGNRFQSGLFGTWLHTYYEQKPEERLYSDIEGGLGWWRDTQFATETPKFIMGGVALNFSAWANGLGAGKGRDWSRPLGKYGVIQLSPYVLWPPDGLNLKQGTAGELFGYGYVPLPLTEPQKRTAGKDVPTGNQCWTLFLNTANFKGPVAFFAPWFWSKPTLEQPGLAGMFLDSRPATANFPIQMETQYIPAVVGRDRDGNLYARVAVTQFPDVTEGASIVLHRVTSYTKGALWDRVKAWFEGGPPAEGRIDPAAGKLHTFPGRGWGTWRIYTPGVPKEQRVRVAWEELATPQAVDPMTFGFRWNPRWVQRVRTPHGPLVKLPEFYRQQGSGKEARWVPVQPEQVPAETGLAEVRFPDGRGRITDPYVTPQEPDSCWKKPGPVAGPFKARLGDGSEVTYYWYRFADQPALVNADLTDAQRERLQQRVERLHRHWKPDHDYLPPPRVGRLASLDPALFLTPPPGLEVGYVPIAVRQGPPGR